MSIHSCGEQTTPLGRGQMSLRTIARERQHLRSGEVDDAALGGDTVWTTRQPAQDRGIRRSGPEDRNSRSQKPHVAAGFPHCSSDVSAPVTLRIGVWRFFAMREEKSRLAPALTLFRGGRSLFRSISSLAKENFHETDISAKSTPPQAQARLSPSDEDPCGPQHRQGPSRQRSQASRRLSAGRSPISAIATTSIGSSVSVFVAGAEVSS